MNRTRAMIYCGLFAALIAVGAFIRIPIPVVPFTLQYLFTMLAGLLLGPRYGAAAVAVYMALGLAGLPIFSEGGGLFYVLKPSFGYIPGFCLGAWVTGSIASRRRDWAMGRTLAANFAGLMTVYAVGMAYYYAISNWIINVPIAAGPLFMYCFVLAVPGDICLCLLAALVARRVGPMFDRMIATGASASAGGVGQKGAQV